jgi:hypothetical protein
MLASCRLLFFHPFYPNVNGARMIAGNAVLRTEQDEMRVRRLLGNGNVPAMEIECAPKKAHLASIRILRDASSVSQGRTL